MLQELFVAPQNKFKLVVTAPDRLVLDGQSTIVDLLRDRSLVVHAELLYFDDTML